MRAILATAAALAVAFAAAVAVPAAVPAAVPRNLPGCFGRSGVQYDSHVAYECIFGQKGNGALYWAQNLYVIEYYWHPAKGDEVVTEIYFKPPGTSWPGVSGNGNPLVTPLGLPFPPRSNGRIVVLADGCVVSWPALDQVPTDCTSTSQGGQPGETHQMTPVEQASVSGFAKIMFAAVPDRAW